MRKLAILLTVLFVTSFFVVSSAQAVEEGGCCKAKQEQAQCPKSDDGGCQKKECPKAGENKEGCPDRKSVV
jgi:hypothetical protein